MGYCVRHVVDGWNGREFWALVETKTSSDEKVPYWEEDVVVATGATRPEFELKLASLGIETKNLETHTWKTETRAWTAWSVGKAENDG